jgi:hypothetical protein
MNIVYCAHYETDHYEGDCDQPDSAHADARPVPRGPWSTTESVANEPK